MIVDKALRELETAGRPLRVGIVGAGASGRAIALHLGTPVPGIRLVAIGNRTLEYGERAFRQAGIQQWRRAETAREAETWSADGMPALTDETLVLTTCRAVDVIVDVAVSLRPAG